MSDVAATDPVKARLPVNALETPTRLSRSSLIVVILQSRWVTSAPPPHSAVPPHSGASTAALEQQQPTVVVTEVEESSLTNLTAQLGTSVFLPCRTEEPTERQDIFDNGIVVSEGRGVDE
ncbi:hypothetical protein E2C01_029574 [Portunus trituberculatus]|uniref:Uncharacterized protein n=1 Tax=Portunus trituberculatus TaxID=210409 RepID=A0A5B7ESB4_PORTR|nr:hypothetical protein [Portunus trituberculatus]